MAEAIVSTILEQLTAFTIDKASEAWRLVKGVEKEVQRLESNFKAIQYELEDAEEKQYLDKPLKHWLGRIKKVSYDMEDVLDDCKAGVETSSTSVQRWKVCSCFSFGSQVVRRHGIATRIKDINEKLDRIVKDKDKFELIKRESIQQPKRPESTCFAIVSDLYGRDVIKRQVIETLLCGSSKEEERSRFPTITTIVGMAGVGKTALAQLIYNDDEVKKHFEEKIIWVCVSDSSDGQIGVAILKNLDSKIPLQNTDPLQIIHSQIVKETKQGKFLLVLDDVWTKDVWENLKPIFQSAKSGSRILVTTRHKSVAKHMESSKVFNLDLLSDDICWQILSQEAFGRNRIDCGNFEDIGREIAEKCKGLPLAAKSLGRLLQGKSQRSEWGRVLESDVWNSEFVEKHIYALLLLSYYNLCSKERRCLLYCAIFPKDYNIDPDELVQHWMAQGYLGSDVNSRTEGEDYFKRLAAHSFFQELSKDRNIICYKMHDIIHEFVRFLTKDGFVTEEIIEGLTLNLSSKEPRHLRLVIKDCGSSPMSIYGTEKLRSLVAVSLGSKETSSEALQNLYGQSRHLRLLEFNNFCLCAEAVVLDKRNLIHLRYLSLVNCSGIESLLEAVCELSNLQFLNIRRCRTLKKLPVGIAKLINLRYLCIEACLDLTCYPKGISNLTSLVRLNKVIVRADRNDANELSIGDLENLDLLGGNICVELTGDAIDWDEAKRAKLHNKIHLKRMEIWLCSPRLKKEEVVQALNPPSNLLIVSYDYDSWRQSKSPIYWHPYLSHPYPYPYHSTDDYTSSFLFLEENPQACIVM